MATEYRGKLTIKPIVGEEIELNDSNALMPNALKNATAAWGQLLQKNAVKVETKDGTLLIPYHAVVQATMSITSSTKADPVDSFCA